MLWLDYCRYNRSLRGSGSLYPQKDLGTFGTPFWMRRGLMLTKEKVADIFKSVVRIFPGMPSYQEREGLRAQDKIIRSQLAARIEEQVEQTQQVIAELTNRAMLKPLAVLDRLSRKLSRLADTIRFASYGYAGLFAAAPVDEQKLAALYDYDLSLHQEIEELAVAMSTLQDQKDEEWEKSSLENINQVIDRLEERIQGRQSIFTQN
jgi:hypothetical protein